VLVPAGARGALPGAELVAVVDLAEAVAWLSSTGVHAPEPGR
jgi:hypothetical protein